MATRATVGNFWQRVKHKTHGCWPWQGGIQSRGYGTTWFDGKDCTAHRVAYVLTHGSIPNDSVVDHLCSNRRCCNPAHLQLVSNSLNIGRGSNKKHAGGNRYRNVHWRKDRHRWSVKIENKGRIVRGGCFDHAEVAAMQADVLAARYFLGFREFNAAKMG